jgi:rare lipoprotein A
MKLTKHLYPAIKTGLLVFIFIAGSCYSMAQADSVKKSNPSAYSKGKRIFYGQASYYANKFNGRKTASGEIFSQEKYTAACNVLPLGTWIKVTNLRNKKSVVVKTTDRLHPKMRRLVDLSRVAAQKLGYIGHGLAKVKVEVINKK